MITINRKGFFFTSIGSEVANPCRISITENRQFFNNNYEPYSYHIGQTESTLLLVIE